MTMNDYATAAELDAMGVALPCDVDLWNNELAHAYGKTAQRKKRTTAAPDPLPERDQPQRRLHRSTRRAGKRIV